MADKDTFKQFAASLQNKFPGLPPGYADFVAQESQGDWEKAENLYLKAIKEEYFVSKTEGKQIELPEITPSDAEKISKYYEEEFNKQRKSGKGSGSKPSPGPKIADLDNLKLLSSTNK